MILVRLHKLAYDQSESKNLVSSNGRLKSKFKKNNTSSFIMKQNLKKNSLKLKIKKKLLEVFIFFYYKHSLFFQYSFSFQSFKNT